MKRKRWAFSISLVLMLLAMLGPRHPGTGLGSITLPERLTGPVASRVERGEPAIVINGTPMRLRFIWTGGCGEEVLSGDRISCAVYILSNPLGWLNR